MKDPLLTCGQVAKRLSCSLATVSRLVKSNSLPCVRLNGGYRFDESRVEQWILGGGHHPARKKGRPRMVDTAVTQQKKVSNSMNSQDGDWFKQPVEEKI